jgi:hypothetical protein
LGRNICYNKEERSCVSILLSSGNLNHIWTPWRMTYIQSSKIEGECAFCIELGRPDGPENLIVFRGPAAFVILNRYPYTSGHLMVVPYDHQPSLEGNICYNKEEGKYDRPKVTLQNPPLRLPTTPAIERRT